MSGVEARGLGEELGDELLAAALLFEGGELGGDPGEKMVSGPRWTP
jgi:hypothetical protein